MSIFRGCGLFLLAVLLILPGCADESASARAESGRIDLSRWNGGENRIVALDGQWAFYWGQLLEPDDFSGNASSTQNGYLNVPGYWNGRVIEGREVPGHGYATFRLVVKLGPDHPKSLAIRMEDQSTAYRLFVDGQPAIANGVVGTSRETTTPLFRTEVYAFHPKGETIRLILQVANFHVTRGGPYHRIYLGPEAAVRRHQTLLWAFDLVLFGILMVIGLYHLVIFFLRPKEVTPLFFGLFCLLWCFRIPFLGPTGKFITVIVPDFPWWLAYKIDLATWYLAVTLMVNFIIRLFPDDTWRWVGRLSWIFGLTFLAVVSATPVWVASYTVFPYEMLCLAALVLIVIILIRALILRYEGALTTLIGFILFMLTVLNDILYDNQLIYTCYLIPLGMVLMILSQSFLISKRSSDAFASVETLSEALKEKNLLLSRADKLKDEFLANTSHELRTPLHGIIGMAESLQEAAFAQKSETVAANLAIIIKSARRLSVMIDDILDFSKIRARDIRLDKRIVDIRSVTEIVLALARPLVKGKDLKLVNGMPAGTPFVLADEDRVQQILLNLIGNAVKFTRQGRIEVTAAEREGFLEITISDTGAGISPEHQARIFEPFEQGDHADTKHYGGTGLGLSITKHLVEFHGGTIGLASEPGRGTSVSFTLPIGRGEPTAEQRPLEAGSTTAAVSSLYLMDKTAPIIPSAAGHEANDQAPLILVVDDDPVNLQVVANHLASAKYRVELFSNGPDVLTFLRREGKAAMVLLDIMMPDLNGYQVCRKIRNEYTSSEMPVIMLTAKNRTTDLVQGFESGANDYLMKPFSRNELLARVEIHIKLQAAYLTLRQNVSLKKELEQRKETEQRMRMTQRRLSEMLNRVDAAILAVNEIDEIFFCNRQCEQILGYEPGPLLGQPVETVLYQDDHALYRQMKENLDDDGHGASGQSGQGLRFRNPEGRMVFAETALTLLDFDDEPLLLIIIGKKNARPSERGRSQPGIPIPEVVEVMNQNRRRLRSLEAALDQTIPKAMLHKLQVSDELKSVDMALESLGRSLAVVDSLDDKRKLSVELLNLSLDYWSESTGTTKADLAAKSGIWRVYTNKDGWDRTQTLDRYLDLATLPKMPRWKKVSDTAGYVLAYCETESPLRCRLETLFAQYRNLDWK